MVKYRMRIVTFPEAVVRGASVQNKDGSFTLYVDSRRTKEEQDMIVSELVSSIEKEDAHHE